MSKAKSTPRQNRRGSPEAIEKRRAARLFNDVLGGGRVGSRLDGRTEKRRQRLLSELESGKTRGARGEEQGSELKPLDVLQHVQELLEMGESLSAIKKVAKVKKEMMAPAESEDVAEVIGRLHRAYGFKPEVYRFVGIGDEVLRGAGVLESTVKQKPKTRRRG